MKDSLTHLLEIALQVNPDAVVADANRLLTRYPSKSRRQAADYVISKMAQALFAAGFLTGIPSNPVYAGPAALTEMGLTLRHYAYVCALVGYLSDPNYFLDPTWKSDALIVLAGPKALSQALGSAGVKVAQHATKKTIKGVLKKEVLAAVKRFFLKYLGIKVTQKGFISKSIPVVGGVIGGAWNSLEARGLGARMLKYHFE